MEDDRNRTDTAKKLRRVMSREECKQLIGKKRGLLRVDDFHHTEQTVMFWCYCECGNDVLLTQRELISMKLKSCGHAYNKKETRLSVERVERTMRGGAVLVLEDGEDFMVRIPSHMLEWFRNRSRLEHRRALRDLELT
jgi:hypothetical protein